MTSNSATKLQIKSQIRCLAGHRSLVDSRYPWGLWLTRLIPLLPLRYSDFGILLRHVMVLPARSSEWLGGCFDCENLIELCSMKSYVFRCLRLGLRKSTCHGRFVRLCVFVT